ncbi:ABC transporter substrate-binding protein [Cryptosporangium sp. NPDC051539]|uniref:ABC transporter substrate-binding protein n=1 Tax=Cryptosporangium sp. NPDC051539 TaxID=3363962 RepID=UPI0037AFF910
MNRRFRIAATLTALTLAVTACGDGGTDTAGGGPATIKVTSFGCEIWNTWAEAKGVFAKHDLKVELVKSTGGSAAVAAVLSGAADLGYVNGYSAINAYNTGFPIEMVAGANTNATPPAKPAQGVFVGTNSPLQSAKDLAGKTIAVNELNGLNQIVTSTWLKQNGVDVSSVRFVALPFSDQVPALLSGKVDAAQLGYSLLGDNNGKVRSLADPFASAGTVYIATYVASKAFVAKGDTAKRFHDAMVETMDALGKPENTVESFELLSACQKVPADVLEAQPQNAFSPSIDLAALNTMAAQMVEQKILPKKPELDAFVPEFARS